MTRAVLIALLLVLAPTAAHAWGPVGHRIVCGIAWDEMQPHARDAVKQILTIETKDQFADLCNWADRHRFEHPETAAWHYVEVPEGATSVDIARDCSEPASCAVTQIVEKTQALKQPDGWVDAAATLKFLIHIVGDIHQPLHASDSRDRGGFDTYGEFLGETMRLHRVWDIGILAIDDRTWDEIATSLQRRVSAVDRQMWAKAAPRDWANESLAISLAPATRKVVEGGTFSLGEEYAREKLPVVYDRLSRAGIRLGAALNEALK